MASLNKRRATPPGEAQTVEEAPKRSKHRAAYPTPLFKTFTVILHIIALPLGSLLLSNNFTTSTLALFLMGVLGLLIALYANFMEPLASNLKLRKVLIGIMTGYGGIILVAYGVTYLFTG